MIDEIASPFADSATVRARRSKGAAHGVTGIRCGWASWSGRATGATSTLALTAGSRRHTRPIRPIAVRRLGRVTGRSRFDNANVTRSS